MSQPPQGEDPQDQRGAAPGWGPPSSPSYQGGWGQQAGAPHQGWDQPGGYGAPAGHGQPGQYGPPYGPPAQYGQPGQYGGQPGYGPQPYGQYGPYGGWEQPPAPARRPRRFGLLFVLLVVAALIGLAFTLPARLGGTRLDPAAVQRDVAQQFQQREGVALDLRCDQTMTVADGRTYHCTGTTAAHDPVTITLRLTGDKGAYTWSDS